MWMTSISTKDRRGRIVPPTLWTRVRVAKAEKVLRAALRGLGDVQRERCYIGGENVALCHQRVLTPAEVASMPASFREFVPEDEAGEPLILLWKRP